MNRKRRHQQRYHWLVLFPTSHGRKHMSDFVYAYHQWEKENGYRRWDF